MKYHKIQTVYKRDPNNRFKTLLIGDYSLPEFEYLASNEWVFTEKVDGTNIRVIWDGKSIKFGGRTDRAQIPAHLGNTLNEMFLPQVDLFAEKFPSGCVLFGEGYGAKIQKGGGNYLPYQSFVLFDVNVGGWWLERHNVEDVADTLRLDVVPIIERGSLEYMVSMARDGFSSRWGDFRAEGIVARPSVELLTRNGDRLITKIKCKDFE
jgi:hypothetical protein